MCLVFILWIRVRLGTGLGWFKGGLRCKGWVNSVIINAITEINYRCNYMQVVLS